MSRFNTQRPTSKTTNLAGGEAYTQSPKLEFVSILLTSFVQNQYHRSADDGLDRVRELMGEVDPVFAAKAALYARNEFGMRSISHVVAGEIAQRVKGESWTKKFFNDIVHRPDDMMEILSYIYSIQEGKHVEPNALKRGFAQAFAKFDEYQLSKYRAASKEVSLVDVANLVHATHTPAVQKLIEDKLRSIDTWETKLVQAGQTAETDEDKEKLKGDAWRTLLKENKLGYFALLRNLRNIIEQAPDMVSVAAEQLQNEKALRKSLVMPFRFFSAYKELAQIGSKDSRTLMAAVGSALDMSVANMPAFENALVVVDHSGSMDSSASEKSAATMFEIGALFGIALAKSSNADFMYFGDIAKYYNVTDDSVLGQLNWLAKCNNGYFANATGDTVGHGTNFHAIFDTAQQAYDRIFIFSDMQAWENYYTPKAQLESYKQRTGANPKIFSFDLSGYGSMQFPEPNVFAIAGFSDKVLDVLKLLEQDKNALVNEIEKVEL